MLLPRVLHTNPMATMSDLSTIYSHSNTSNIRPCKRLYHLFVEESGDEASEGGDGEWEDAVAEDADGLKERERAAEQLRIERDHRRAHPNDHKYGREHERTRVIGRSET